MYDVLQKLNFDKKTEAMCFDTTSSNTGCHKDACVILEQLLGRDLLHIRCRRHIFDILAKTAIQEIMGTSSSPEIKLFKQFKEKWKSINQLDFHDFSSDEYTAKAISDIECETMEFLKRALDTKQPRGDYKELIEIT